MYYLLALFLLFVGCTQPPEVPNLKRSAPTELQRYLLRERIEARDIRQIVEILNRNGALESLRSFVTKLSDQDIENLSSLFSTYFYEEAHRSDGAIRWLESKTDERSFTVLDEKTAVWMKDPELSQLLKGIPSFLGIFQTPDLLARDIDLLNPKLHPDWITLWESDYSNDVFEQSTLGIKPQQWTADLEQWISNLDEWLPPLVAAAQKWERYRIASGLGDALSSLGRSDFEGLGYTVKRLMTPSPFFHKHPGKNRLQDLLDFVQVTNGGTRGAFTTLENFIVSDQTYGTALAEKLTPFLLQGATGFVREILEAEHFNESFWQALAQGDPVGVSEPFRYLFENLALSLSRFSGSESTGFLVSYALSRWIENNARAHPNMFLDWDQPIALSKFTLVLSTKDASGNVQIAADQQMALETLDLKTLIKEKNWELKFSFSQTVECPPEALRRALEICHNQLPLGDATASLQSLIFEMTRPSKNSLFRLSEFDKIPNLFNAFQVWIAGHELPFIRRTKSTLFDRLKLGTESITEGAHTKQKRDFLSTLEGNPQAQKLTETVLDTLRVVVEFDTPPHPGLPSALEFYRTLLVNVPPAKVDAITAAFEIVNQIQLGHHCLPPGEGEEGSYVAKYPALCKMLSAGWPIASLLTRLSLLSYETQDLRLAAWRRALGTQKRSGVEIHLRWLEAALGLSPTSFEILFERLEKHRELPQVPWLTENEWHLLTRIFNDPHWLELFASLQNLFTQTDLLQLVQNVQRLQTTGELTRILRQLGYLRNYQWQITIQALQNWDRSGELAKILNTLRQFLEKRS